MYCYLCGDQDDSSYFLRIEPISKKGLKEGIFGFIVEVCPECHHFFTYGTEEQIKNYILKNEINMRGIRI